MLTLPDLENCGVREIIPFGFRLSPVSEIELVKTKQSVQSEIYWKALYVLFSIAVSFPGFLISSVIV